MQLDLTLKDQERISQPVGVPSLGTFRTGQNENSEQDDMTDYGTCIEDLENNQDFVNPQQQENKLEDEEKDQISLLFSKLKLNKKRSSMLLN